MSAPHVSSLASKERRSEGQGSHPVMKHDSSSLGALDRVGDRIKTAKLPNVPNFLTVEGSLIPSAAIGAKWVEGTPFSHFEGYLQYSTFLSRHSSDTLLRTRSSIEITNAPPISNSTSVQDKPIATTSTSQPKDLSISTAPKKKISLSDYAARNKAGSKSSTSSPAHQVTNQSDDLRKDAIKRDVELNGHFPPAIAEKSNAGQSTAALEPANIIITTPSPPNNKRPADTEPVEQGPADDAGDPTHSPKKRRITPPSSPKAKDSISQKSPKPQPSKSQVHQNGTKAEEHKQTTKPTTESTASQKMNGSDEITSTSSKAAEGKTNSESTPSSRKRLHRWIPTSPSPPPEPFFRIGEAVTKKRKVAR